MVNCSGCNSCQECDSGCQVCNKCESIECNTYQTLCKINCQVALQYKANPWADLCFIAGELITYKNLTSAKIQEAYNWITAVAAEGDTVNTMIEKVKSYWGWSDT